MQEFEERGWDDVAEIKKEEVDRSITLAFLRFRRLGKENMLPVPMSLLLVRMNSQFCSPSTVQPTDRMKGFFLPPLTLSSESDGVGGGGGGEE